LLREGACKAWIHSLGAMPNEQFDEELVEDRRYEFDNRSLVAA
jgi:mevalonate kinase